MSLRDRALQKKPSRLQDSEPQGDSDIGTSVSLPNPRGRDGNTVSEFLESGDSKKKSRSDPGEQDWRVTSQESLEGKKKKETGESPVKVFSTRKEQSPLRRRVLLKRDSALHSISMAGQIEEQVRGTTNADHASWPQVWAHWTGEDEEGERWANDENRSDSQTSPGPWTSTALSYLHLPSAEIWNCITWGRFYDSEIQDASERLPHPDSK